jgi:hypothetical protein
VEALRPERDKPIPSVTTSLVCVKCDEDQSRHEGSDLDRPVYGWMECFMTPNHAASYPCCHDLQVIKKRLALSKQVLLLSARHFYIRPPIPPPLNLPSLLCLPFTRPHHHSSPVELHAQRRCLPPYQPREFQTQRMELAMARSATHASSGLPFGHRACRPGPSLSIQSTRRASGLRCRTSGAAAGPRRPDPTLSGWQVKAAARPHRIGMGMAVIEANRLSFFFSFAILQLTVAVPEN